ncbi:MAG: histidine phosphatase family protein [Chloroflexi bacterium]|nr:histidine phosphatase family protein [Chloroflexota bacterium]
MIKLLLVRHGLTDWNMEGRMQGQTDVPLNDIGREQARRLAPLIQEMSIDAVLASDLSRAWETAEIITMGKSLELKPEPRLREVGMGVFESLTYVEALEKYPVEVQAWVTEKRITPEGGESSAEFAGRVGSLLTELRQNDRDQTLLLVGHGGSIREMMRLALGISEMGRGHFEIENTSVTELHFVEDYPIFHKVNDTRHLDGFEEPKKSI